ncbi:hypothetical protein [Lentzea guizhouensis]|uniref:hypothetical protein n=1 Tax=Lentzea guizhouensis TaxID=1586287 RepID=UPI001472C0CB|nr:hypothetical protein [Lentzea guizhouensis]
MTDREPMKTQMPDSAARAVLLEARTTSGEELGVWEGEEVGVVLDLVASFPTGEPARCYNPAYAIDVYGADDPLFTLKFCYGCCWVGVEELDERHRLVAFDPGSAPARELLDRFKAFTP